MSRRKAPRFYRGHPGVDPASDLARKLTEDASTYGLRVVLKVSTNQQQPSLNDPVACQNSADAKQHLVGWCLPEVRIVPLPRTARMRPMQPYQWQFLALTFAGWVNRSQQDVIEYLKEENRVLRAQLGARRLRFTDDQRRRLAAKAKAMCRENLREIADLVTPDTLLRWYRKLITAKHDGSHRRGPGRPRVMETIRELVLTMAKENSTGAIRGFVGLSLTWATRSAEIP